MPRGGHRDNAGRKSGWNNNDTQTIRVPKVFANQLLEIAKDLDEEKAINLRRRDWVAILQSMDEFVESLQGTSGANQYKKKGEVNTKGERWYFFNKFRNQVKSTILKSEQNHE